MFFEIKDLELHPIEFAEKFEHGVIDLGSDYRQISPVVHNSRQKVRVVFLSKEGSVLVKLVEPADPTSPVWKGEIQAPGLGMAADVWSETGAHIEGERGELVCTKTFPSMPVKFWNDAGGKK